MRETVQEFRNRLATDRGLALMEAMTLYDLQTRDERAQGETIYDNGWGYNQTDAPVLTEIIRRLLAGGEPTEADYWQATRRMPKYAAQLQRFAQLGEDTGFAFAPRVTKSGLELIPVAA